MDILECEGYKKLLEAVEKDEQGPTKCHNYRAKLAWVIERAKHYAEITGLEASDILDSWEKERNYWYMNYYQDGNQPMLGSNSGRVFETQGDLLLSIGKPEFRCPMCGGVSTSPYECNSGKEMSKGKVCDWKVYGLFGDLGKGVFVFAKDQMIGQTIFKPIAWEASPTA